MGASGTGGEGVGAGAGGGGQCLFVSGRDGGASGRGREDVVPLFVVVLVEKIGLGGGSQRLFEVHTVVCLTYRLSELSPHSQVDVIFHHSLSVHDWVKGVIILAGFPPLAEGNPAAASSASLQSFSLMHFTVSPSSLHPSCAEM